MLEKKLLTLAAVLGILASGACFLPPIHQYPSQPPPPRRPELKSIHSVRVTVTDASTPAHVETVRLAKKIGQQLKLESDGYMAPAAENAPADAVFAVTVSAETARRELVNPPTGDEIWLFEFMADATLTRQDGVVLWQSHGIRIHFAHSFPPKHPDDLWKEKAVREDCEFEPAARLANQLLFGMQ